MALLTEDRIGTVHTAVVSLKLDRSALSAGISRSFWENIRTVSAHSQQHYVDLYEMDQVGRLTDGSVPLISWLTAAVQFAGQRHERSVFEKALDEALDVMTAASIHVVVNNEPWQPREVRDAVRVIAFSPTASAAAEELRRALELHIASGEVEWLDPIEGPMTESLLFGFLRREPRPNILHFFGNWGHDKDGRPTLRLTDDQKGEESWLRVDLLAQEIKASCREPLRLIVLEASVDTRRALLVSAAEVLVREGVDAVLAYLPPMGSKVARACSEELYGALSGDGQDHAEVVHSFNEVRRALRKRFQGSVEAFSPELYVRGSPRVLFDFKGRKPLRPNVAPPPAPSLAGGGVLEPPLRRLFDGPFSLLFGDRNERSALDKLRDRFRKSLDNVPAPARPDLPLSALAQDFEFRRGRTALDGAFQLAFLGNPPRSSFFDALARLACSGVHATLLRSPIFELALAEQQPSRMLYVLHPTQKGVTVQRREVGEDWVDLDEPPAAINLETAIVVLRLYGGKTVTGIFTAPLITEDDYLFGFPKLQDVLPPALAAALLRSLRTRPALCLGLSLLAWEHRVARHRLFSSRALPAGSLAILDPGDPYLHLLEEGGEGLPGTRGRLRVLEATEGLVAAVVNLASKAENGSTKKGRT